MDTNKCLDPSSTCNSDSINNFVVLEKEIEKKQSNGQWCSAINCTNNRAANRDMSFFRFPKDKDRCKRWVINSRRQDLLNKSSDQLFKSNVLCANHFENSQFTSLKKIRLKRQKAIPTLFSISNPPARIQPMRKLPTKRRASTVKKHI